MADLVGPVALDGFLARQANIGLLRLLTCGSVDDGKSTLIGRLLWDSQLILDDQLTSLAHDSRRHGTTGADIDLALLVDGLEDERAQGITIDVAYRFFSTAQRRFMVADAPGHEQYTRNMATAAANAELAVVLVDARAGVLTQTRRHSFIAALLGIRHVVLAVNKMDLVDFDPAVFARIRDDYARAVATLDFINITAIPISARFGDNVTTTSPRTPWYDGASLLSHLETVQVTGAAAARPFRMPVQWVNRASATFRGYAGTIASGSIRIGDPIHIARSARSTSLARIVTMDGDLAVAGAGDAVTLVLADAVDVARGDLLQAAPTVPVSARFDADLVWLASAPLVPGRSYLFKIGTTTIPGSIARIHHRVAIATFEKAWAPTLAVNDIGRVTVALSSAVPLERYADSHVLGGFIMIDRQSNATVAAGMVDDISQPSSDITWHSSSVDKVARAALKAQRPVVIWLTGLSGAGKSTIANLVEQRLHALGRHSMILDGDNVRHGLNRDLGFSETDRVENIRRAAEAARLMVEAGLIVIVSFISPYRADRAAARERFEADEFLEVFVDTPIDECRRRDPKGLYRRADAGLIHNFTGVGAPYEAPENPDIRLSTTAGSAEDMAEQVVQELYRRGTIEG